MNLGRLNEVPQQKIEWCKGAYAWGLAGFSFSHTYNRKNKLMQHPTQDQFFKTLAFRQGADKSTGVAFFIRKTFHFAFVRLTTHRVAFQ